MLRASNLRVLGLGLDFLWFRVQDLGLQGVGLRE